MKRIILILAGLALMTACGHKASQEELAKEIEEQEATLNYLDIDNADSTLCEMISLYRQYYNRFPADSMAPVYMRRTADLCITLGSADEAVALLDSIIAMYPDYDDLAGCWFLKGYAYETAENYDSARVAYTYFVETYPDHYLAKDTRTTLQYLGLPVEEMFEAIMAGATAENLVME